MNIPRYKASFPMQTQFVTNADACGDQIFNQVKRQGRVAIYSRTDPESNKIVGYEVIVINTVKAGTVYAKGAKPTEHDSESYPGAKSFGKAAWSCSTEARALQKFAEVVKEEQTTIPVSTVEQETIDIPEGEFSQIDFAVQNCLPPQGTVHNILQSLLAAGKIKVNRKVQSGPGRPKVLYIKA